MSFDAKGMLEVNRDAVLDAARRHGAAVVLSVATWGRGCKPEILVQMEPYVVGRGHNSSLVVVAPEETARSWFPSLALEPKAGDFLAVGVAYGKTHAQWWSRDGQENTLELF